MVLEHVHVTITFFELLRVYLYNIYTIYVSKTPSIGAPCNAHNLFTILQIFKFKMF